MRDVLLWAAAPEEDRGTLFAEGAEQRRLAQILDPATESALRPPLVTIAGALSREAGVTREELASACRKIARWAEEKGLPRTAISFAQAAAVTVPGNARYAYDVGLLCRENAEYPRAETWFRRAIGLARRKDYETYALAHLGLGNLFRARAKYDAAHYLYRRALRTAIRKGFEEIRIMALHNLFSVAVEQVQIEEAERLAKEAYRAYPSDHPRLPALAHDVASFWMLQVARSRFQYQSLWEYR